MKENKIYYYGVVKGREGEGEWDWGIAHTGMHKSKMVDWSNEFRNRILLMLNESMGISSTLDLYQSERGDLTGAHPEGEEFGAIKLT